ncbi:MAG: hypothetical protein ACTS2F_31270 [Thainema sp.]
MEPVSYKYDESGNPIVREEDQIFLKSFGLGFDLKLNRTVAVALRDLARLSAEHQVFWGTKELPVNEYKVLTDYFENQIKGNWIFSRSVFSAFVDEINAIYKLTTAIFGVSIFREELTGEKRPRNFTFFFSPTSKNYYDFINLLDKYISENINKAFFKDKVDLEQLNLIDDNVYERVQKGTLRILEEWLSDFFKYADENIPKEIVKPFKKVRSERQKPAHKVIDNQYDPIYTEKQKEIMELCYFSMRSIRKNIETHPKAKRIELPESIDADNVKYFYSGSHSNEVQ